MGNSTGLRVNLLAQVDAVTVLLVFAGSVQYDDSVIARSRSCDEAICFQTDNEIASSDKYLLAMTIKSGIVRWLREERAGFTRSDEIRTRCFPSLWSGCWAITGLSLKEKNPGKLCGLPG